MRKKGLHKFIAFAAITGAVAAGISYFLKYKSFHNELEEDFHDFESDDFEEDSLEAGQDGSALERAYVTINTEQLAADAEKLKDQVKDQYQTVKESASEMVADVQNIVSHASDQVKEEIEDFSEPIINQAKDSITTIIEEES